MNTVTFYNPETKGIVPKACIIAAVAFAIAAGLGLVYAYLAIWIPLIYVVVLMTAFTGIAVGFVISAVAKMLVFQSKPLLALIGLLSGGVLIYFNWVAWTTSMHDASSLVFELDIIRLYQSAGAELGVWSVFGFTPTGWQLYAFWIVEALILLIAPLIPAFRHLEMPYCGSCSKWISLKLTARDLQHIEQPEQFKEQVTSNGLSMFNQLATGQNRFVCSNLDFIKCPTCTDSHFLQLKNQTIKVDDEGKEDINEDVVVPLIKLSEQDYTSVKDHFATSIYGANN